MIDRVRGWTLWLVREPLVQFFVAGGLIYGLYAVAAGDVAQAPEREIRVTRAEIDWLASTWEARWNRPPTPQEMEGLVRELVRETVLYREALALGLDRNDTIVRRRLAQKLEFLTQDLAELVPPTDDQLKTYFESHRDQYQIPSRLTFTHVYFSPDERGDRVIEDAEAALGKLQPDGASTAVAELGDRFMLQRYYPERAPDEVSKLFGGEFAEALALLRVGEWQGPVRSGYGWHLVLVHDRAQAAMPAFAAVQERVREDWASARRQEAKEQYLASLLARYEVIIEGGAEGPEVVIEDRAEPAAAASETSG
jgi:peptidyl-prolyl cis-trans isomerase C